MGDGITLFEITGLPARIIKAVLGTPFLLVGGVVVYWGTGGQLMENFPILLIGGIVALVGVLLCVSALTDDTFEVSLGGRSSSSFE